MLIGALPAALFANSGTFRPFIYTPIVAVQKAQAKENIWVSKELVPMKTTLSNTLNEDLVLETISLYTEGINFESYPVTNLRLAAGEHGVEVTLHGKALEPGKLVVRGFLVRAFNVESIHWLSSPHEVTVIGQLPQLEIYNDNGCLGVGNTINMLGGQKVRRLRPCMDESSVHDPSVHDSSHHHSGPHSRAFLGSMSHPARVVGFLFLFFSSTWCRCLSDTLHPIPHAPWGVIHLVPMPVGC